MAESESKIILNDEVFDENTLKVSCYDNTGCFIEVKNINKDTTISLNKEDSLILRNFLNENLADEL